MADDIAISVDNVSKAFRLPHERQTSVKGALINAFRPGKRGRGYEKQQVLDGISFEIKKGEFFGIVGRNGSGKSTLLKLLAGIYTPDKGAVNINGKLTPFIELGVGFNPELTGRENVFLNGALLGFNRKEMEAMYNEIVAFAELERFMDQRLKNYSSGMQVRLAFSIAIKAKSDILVLDEVLAVGDEAFQQKCINVFEKYKARNQTIVLVTHDMGIVEKFCDRAMMIKEGEIVKIGNPTVVAAMYSEANKEDYSAQQAKAEQKAISDDIAIRILDPETRKPRKRFVQGSEALVELKWQREGVGGLGVAIYKQSGEYVFGPNTYKEKVAFHDSGSFYYRVKLDIGTGEFYIKAGLFGKSDAEILEFVDDGPTLMIEPRPNEDTWEGITYLPHAWGDGDVRIG